MNSNNKSEIDLFIDRLIQWVKNPSSDLELENWYKNDYPNDIPFILDQFKPSDWEIDFDQYYPMYKKAETLEKQNDNVGALKIYLHILSNYSPIGTSYYERPIILLEMFGEYKTAIKLCERAIKEIKKGTLNFNENEFLHMRQRLKSKLNNYGRNVPEARIETLVNFIRTNPGINKKNLQSFLSESELWSDFEINFVIDHALKNGIINRIKKGRSYAHFVRGGSIT